MNLQSRLFAFVAAVAAAMFSVARAHAQPVQPVPKTLLSLDFAQQGPEAIMAPPDAAKATVTTDAAETVAGSARSLKADSRGADAEWNEFFHSRDDFFPAREAFKVSFDYRVIARVGEANFYTLFRRTGAQNTEGWQEWKGEAGATGHVETSFATRNATNFFWIIGIHGKGAIAIDHLRIVTDPQALPPDVPKPVRTWMSSGSTKYYVDANGGDDANDGKSDKHAWRSLDKVNSGTFAAGDQVLLRAGGAWTGFLAPGGSGADRKAIIVGSYGKGAKPRIDAKGGFLAAVFLDHQEQIEVRDLDVANTAPFRLPGLAGVLVREEDFGVVHHVLLSRLDVHDVMGSDVKDAGGGSGIKCTNGGRRVKTCYDDLKIENCTLLRTDRNGIDVDGNWQRDGNWFPSRHVVIAGNRLTDIGGDGIVPIGCDGALVEHNILQGGRMRAEDYAAGIWPWSCDNTTIQFNEVSGMHGTKDGEGYDSDYNCRNTLFQYNYSHDNDGGFMLICDDGSQSLPNNIGNSGTVIRYNISANDGLHTFNISGPCQNTQIYNNTFYVGKGQDAKFVASGNWGGSWATGTHFVNNLFYSDGTAGFDPGGMTDLHFDRNAYWGGISAAPTDTHKITADPHLNAPWKIGFPPDQRFSPLRASSLFVGGLMLDNNGARDYVGGRVGQNRPPTIGALQYEYGR